MNDDRSCAADQSTSWWFFYELHEEGYSGNAGVSLSNITIDPTQI